MKVTKEQAEFLARYNIPESAIERFSPSSEIPVSVRDRDIFLDGPIVSSLEEKLYRAFGLDLGLVSPSAFREALDKVPSGDITVSINSPGGMVFDAAAIQSMILDRQKNDQVRVAVRGIAASAASFIAFSGEPIEMAPMAMIMVHRSSAIAYGNGADLRKSADVLDKVDDNLADQLSDTSNLSRDEAAEAIAAETWYTAKEALDLGIVDTILSSSDDGSKSKASARAGLSALASHLQFGLGGTQ